MMEECQLCCCPLINTTSNTLKTESSLWTYLYHKNVREALLPLSGGSEGGATMEGNRVPKLTFTFSFEGTPSPSHLNNGDKVGICEECLKEVELLESLHAQLESCKKLVAAQVDRLVKVEEPAVRNRGTRNPLWGKGATEYGLDVSLAGATVGKDNISQVLRCLGTLCEGVGNSQGHRSIAVSGPTTSHPGESLNNDTRGHEHEEVVPAVKLEPTSDNDLEDELLLDSLFTAVREHPPGKDNCVPTTSRAAPNSPASGPTNNLHRREAPTKMSRSTYISSKGQRPAKKIKHQVNRIQTLPHNYPGSPHKSKSKAGHQKPEPIKKHQCDLCGRMFAQKGSANKHRRTHTGEKPFKCTLCECTFAQSSNLHRHFREKHKAQKIEKMRQYNVVT